MGYASRRAPVRARRSPPSPPPPALARAAAAAAAAAAAVLVAAGGAPRGASAQAAVPFAECPTGVSFPLTSATTAYTSAASGWGRKADLVNEQGESFVYRGWEPGFPDAVSVAVSWGSPVTASHILVARDPNSPTAGTVTLTAAGSAYAVAMAGQGGWIAVALPPGTALQSFTIGRADAASNVMEVAVCVPDGATGGGGGGGPVGPPAPTAAPPPAGGGGVPFAECPTGSSFPLTSATTAYTSSASGWGRKADLVNEQGESFVYRGWEPGFPNAVSVAVSWGSPVTASHILVARDPNSPTAGTVTLTAAGATYAVAMAGQGGWIATALPPGTALQSFTIARADAASNVMEVAVCVPGGAGGDGGGGSTGGGGGSSSSSSPACSPLLEDSFGDQPPPADTDRGLDAWQAVDRYYTTDAPVNVGALCPQAVHDTYWVRGEDGNVYPTWHPATGSFGGQACAFGHEHGENPLASALYCLSRGLPFGITHRASGNARKEDHVGHKVTARNQFEMVEGSPFTAGLSLTRTGIVCSWLSKLHQGTHSNDALGENAHEYFLSIDCDDQTVLVLKQLAIFGPPGSVTSDCNDPAEEQATGVAAPSGVTRGDYGDGKREFRCPHTALFSNAGDPIFELWKTLDRPQPVAGGGSYAYAPYYMVLNPARYYIDGWQALGLPGPAVHTVDLCYSDTVAYAAVTAPAATSPGALPDICNGLPAALAAVAPDERWRSPLSPFVGDRRGVHPKKVQIWNDAGPATALPASPTGSRGTVFCTDAYGDAASFAGPAGCAAEGKLTQVVGALKNGWTGRGGNPDRTIDGTAVGAVVGSNGGLTGPGPGLEWIVSPVPGAGVVVPN